MLWRPPGRLAPGVHLGPSGCMVASRALLLPCRTTWRSGAAPGRSIRNVATAPTGRPFDDVIGRPFDDVMGSHNSGVVDVFRQTGTALLLHIAGQIHVLGMTALKGATLCVLCLAVSVDPLCFVVRRRHSNTGDRGEGGQTEYWSVPRLIRHQ